MSNDIVSMSLAMVAENRTVKTILSELFSSEGNEIYMRPATAFIAFQPLSPSSPRNSSGSGGLNRSLSRSESAEETLFVASEALSFWDVGVRARSKGDLLIGYRVSKRRNNKNDAFFAVSPCPVCFTFVFVSLRLLLKLYFDFFSSQTQKSRC